MYIYSRYSAYCIRICECIRESKFELYMFIWGIEIIEIETSKCIQKYKKLLDFGYDPLIMWVIKQRRFGQTVSMSKAPFMFLNTKERRRIWQRNQFLKNTAALFSMTR